MTRRTLYTTLGFLCLTLALFSPVHAEENLIAKTAKKLEKEFGANQTAEMMQKVQLLIKAGLSYQKNVAAPIDQSLYCKHKEQLRVLLGVYAIDANYALAFGKIDQFNKTLTAMQTIMNEKLDLDGKLQLEPLDPKLMQELAKDPLNEKNQAHFLALVQKNLNNAILKAQSDSQVLDVLMDAIYGSVIEGLHITSTLALYSDPSEELTALFNSQLERVKKYQELLNSVEDSEIAELVERADRGGLLMALKKLLIEKKGKLTRDDIQWVNMLVSPSRNGFAFRCE